MYRTKFWEKKGSPEVGLRVHQNFQKLFQFLRLFLCQNYQTFEVPTRGSFSSTDLKFGSFIAK